MNTLPPATCKNCDAQLQGEFCHHCGQQDKRYLRSIFAVLGDLFGELGHWDSRFYRTLTGLMFKPGFLSLQFFKGRHASYVPPLRLYFFISLIAFLVLTSLIDVQFRELQQSEQQQLAEAQKQLDEQLVNPLTPLLDENGQLKPPKVQLQGLEVLGISEQTEAELEQKVQSLLENPQQFGKKLMSMTPQMMLVMLPFWALFLKLCYVFSRHYYLEHLTVALHTHAFILLSLMLVTIIGSLADVIAGLGAGGWADISSHLVQTVIFAWIIVYLLLTQKNVYQQGWPLTLIKFLFCAIGYIILLAIFFALMIVVGILNS
ncbi:DUF3667 domain-containing protein [Idiomarina seosinensis]|uniref:DUF3667 domain-containing protein n=1 Tax=Idiomarina seosinensis TaxID=281739 RepID=UPI003850EA7B